MTDVLLRRGGAQDLRFLRDMLHHAYYWRERVPGSLVSRYVRGWGRPGDTALIAIDDGFPVGAAWYRLLPACDAQVVSSNKRPRVALLSNGAEAGKGPVAVAPEDEFDDSGVIEVLRTWFETVGVSPRVVPGMTTVNSSPPYRAAKS